MTTRPLPLIPLLARRRRRARVQRGAKLGAPALLALGAAAGAYLVRRRRRSAAGHDASPSELAGRPAGMSAAATATAETAAAAGRATTMDGDPDAIAPNAAAAGTSADTSADDPLVREAENAAAGEAGAIGGDVPPTPPTADSDFATDEATRPVEEHSGSAYESFSERES